MWEKVDTDLGRLCPTERKFREIERSPHSASLMIREQIQKLASQYKFLHWHLAFPDVFVLTSESGKIENEQTGWSRGFDVVLGNPPWERVVVKEKEFFAKRSPDVASAKTAAARRALITKLEENEPSLFRDFREAQRLGEGESHILRWSGKFPMCGVGRDINSAYVFSELSYQVIQPSGKLGLIVPSAIVTDNTTKLFFQDMIESDRLVSVFDFENRAKLFADIDSRMKFCLLTLSGVRGVNASEGPIFSFYLTNPSDLAEEERRFSLSASDILRINPNTRTCPVFRNRKDAELAKSISGHTSIISHDERTSNREDWGVRTRPGLYHMSNDSSLFRTATQLEDAGFTRIRNQFTSIAGDFLPLYEAKMVHQFDHRWLSFGPNGEAIDSEQVPHSAVDLGMPKFWVPAIETLRRAEDSLGSQLVVRVITNPTNERTVISAVLPKYGIGNSLLLVVLESQKMPLLNATLNSLAADYFARQKLAGTNLNPYIFKQLPVPTSDALHHLSAIDERTSWWQWILARAFELTYTAWDLNVFALDCGFSGPPFQWDCQRRFQIRCELDAAYFHLYLGSGTEWGMSKGENKGEGNNETLLEMFPTPRDAVSYIMDTFPIVRRKDEAKYGEYRTKRVILEIYDQMTEIIEANEAIRAANPGKSEEELRPLLRSYQSPLNPPPGPPTDADGNFIPYADWTDEIRQAYREVIHIDSVSPSQSDKDRSRERQRLEQGQGILYLRLILMERNVPVQFEVLASDLCFALNTGLRRRFLLDEPVPDNERSNANTTAMLPNLLAQVEALHASGVVTIETKRGRRMVSLADLSGLDSDLSKAMAAHVKEAIEATTKLIGKRDNDAFRTGAFDELQPFIKEDELENLTTL